MVSVSNCAPARGAVGDPFDEGLPSRLISGVLSKAARIAVALMLALSVGGHWAVLQTVAWVGMAIEYSQCMPVDQALVATFDGSRPCSLCQAVQQGRAEERKQSVLNPAKDFKGLLQQPAVALNGPHVAPLPLLPEPDPHTPFFQPPHPPPRAV